MSAPDQSNTAVDELDNDWLDKILEQYWKQRHGMYNANQDDVEMANREAKDAICSKIVELVLKDRQLSEAHINTILKSIQDELVGKKVDLRPEITEWLVSKSREGAVAHNAMVDTAIQIVTKRLANLEQEEK